ncbi:MAG: YgiQ family radical SAM protein [Bacteroidota bacterium]|nr:YgiQ family radical SAM protein [Bacteroidota bacterium]
MFIPTTKEEIKKLGWKELDVILVSGDTYIDSSYNGAAIIGKLLMKYGYKVGMIAQPDLKSNIDITRLGEPKLFWGVTSGCVDSMVANFTASKKRRRNDDFTPGGLNTKRPDRAVIVYSNLIRQHFKKTKPIVLGGVEASLRRIAHYDYWDDKIRKPILLDAKADYLVYGMGEKPVLDLAENLSKNENPLEIRGLCYISKEPNDKFLSLPSYEEVAADKNKFIEMFHIFYNNNDSLTARGLNQRCADRYVIQNPPAHQFTPGELDKIYDLDYEREVHPFYRKEGKVKALETIRFSITTHRGCFGECNFCSIGVHQGENIVSRSEASILREAKILTELPGFKGYIHDVGGPTANMYGMNCKVKKHTGLCVNKNCAFPHTCNELNVSHELQIKLLRKIRKLDGVQKAFVASGLRYDLIIEDKKFGNEYIQELAANHVSGQIKVAPEHTEKNILKLMRKPDTKYLEEFKKRFDKASKQIGKKQFLTYYLIAAHPGCSENDMKKLKKYATEELHTNPEQVQIFTPLPSTYSALMYYTGIDPFTGNPLFVEKDIGKKERQKRAVVN